MLRVSIFIIITFAAFASCLQNGLGITPPMGWNSWNNFHCKINETLIRSTADSMIKYGFLNAGYKYLNLDDCWSSPHRNSTGYLMPDPKTFPNGIKALADYVHSKGLLFGIYGDAGTHTCANRAGSLNFEYKDAQVFAEWGVDYLKYDNCNNTKLPAEKRYQRMRDALNAAGRPTYFSLCEWGENKPYIWGPGIGNSWRTTLDIQAEWSSILSILDQQRNITKYAGPGGWNDPDMLEIGNGDLTLNEQKSHFSLWAALKAPLLLGFDVRNPPKDSMTVVLNTEIIAINQDPLGRSVDIVEYDDSYEIWTGPLIDGYVALLLNRGETKIKITLNFKSHLGLKGEIAVRDLWDKKQPNKGNFTESYYSIVPIHSITVLKLQGGIKIS